MILREILKKIWQIELRTNRLVSGSTRCFDQRISTGFRPKAQGCEVGQSGSDRATLGQRPTRRLNRNAVAAIPIAAILYQHRQNPVGVSRGVRSFTQGSFATLGWRPESRWDSLNLTISARSIISLTHRASGRNSKPLEFERFGNCGEFATIRVRRPLSGINPVKFERFRIQEGAHLRFNSPEFEGIGNPSH